MAAHKNKVTMRTVRFDGPSEFLSDPSSGLMIARGECGEVTELDAARLAADETITVEIVEIEDE